jgi:hypothetical protein
MQEFAWLAELIRIWIEGGTWADIKAAQGFQALVGLAAWLIPTSVIFIGISGWTEWREAPLAVWLGFARRAPDENWAENARDLDKDGLPDF